MNHNGNIVEQAWDDLPTHYPHVALGEFCIIPHHVHAISTLIGDARGGSSGCTDPQYAGKETRPDKNFKRHALPEIVRAFKSFSARRINASRRMRGTPVWQRNYYERIIRDPQALAAVQEYIRLNPSRWESDLQFPLEQK